MIGPRTLTMYVVVVGVRLHDVAHALLADDLGDDVVAQRPHRVGRVGQAAAAKVDFRVRLHLHEGEEVLVARLVDEAGAQHMVDAQGLAGRGALRVAWCWQGTACAAPGRSGSACCRRGPPLARCATPRKWRWRSCCYPGQAHAGVGADGQLRPIQRAQGGVPPVEVGAAVGAEEGVRHPDLEDAQPRGALQVHRLPNIKLKVRISSCHALP